jgi:hypothetical protein
MDASVGGYIAASALQCILARHYTTTAEYPSISSILRVGLAHEIWHLRLARMSKQLVWQQSRMLQDLALRNFSIEAWLRGGVWAFAGMDIMTKPNQQQRP